MWNSFLKHASCFKSLKRTKKIQPPPPPHGEHYMTVTGVGEVLLFQLLLFVWSVYLACVLGMPLPVGAAEGLFLELDSFHPVWPEGCDALSWGSSDSLVLLFLDLWKLVLSFTAVPALPDLTGPGVSTRLGCDAQMDHRQEKSFLLPLNMRVMVLILSSLIIQQEAGRIAFSRNSSKYEL